MEIKAKFHNKVFASGDFSICNYTPVDNDVPIDHTKKLKLGRVFSIKGTDLPRNADLLYIFEGDWIYEKQYGWTFVAESFQISIELTTDGIIAYLKTIPGVSKIAATRLVDKFGVDTIDILDNHPEQLKSVLGFTQKKVEAMQKYLKDNQAFQRCSRILIGLGLNKTSISKAFEMFGQKTGELIQENPFMLCKISLPYFRLAEQISEKTGASLKTSARVECGVQYALFLEENQRGNVYAEYEKLVWTTSKLFRGTVSNVAIEKAIELAADEKIITIQKTKTKTLVYSSSLYYAEKESAFVLAQMLAQPMSGPSEEELDELIKQIQCHLKFVLDRTQVKAIKQCVQNSVSVITGGPGTGKTTILKLLKILYQKIWPNLKLNMMAPTGRAARKVAEDAEWPEASTIHRNFSLEASDEDTNKPEKKSIYPFGGSPYALDPAIYIIDEFSMVDMRLMREIMLRMSPGSRLVFVGDPGQLPSVGPGNVLRDIIASKVIPTIMLNVIHRQASEESHIVVNAERMACGNENMVLDTDFQFVETENAQDAQDEIIERFMAEYKKGISLDELQILTPYKKPDVICSTVILNNRLQAKLNPPRASKPEVRGINYIFRTADKVIQQKNVPGKDGAPDIMNGDIGYIKAITTVDDNTVVSIDFGDNRIAQYFPNELNECGIALAYAITTHKSQGSEYRTVIMPIIKDHAQMLQRNLVYTGITRASEQVILIGQIQQLKDAIQRNEIINRNTLFKARLKKYTLKAQSCIAKKAAQSQIA